MEPSASSTSGHYFHDLSALLAAATSAAPGAAPPSHPLMLHAPPLGAQLTPPDMRAEVERQLQRALCQMQALNALSNSTANSAATHHPFFAPTAALAPPPPLVTNPQQPALSTLPDSAATSHTGLSAFADTLTTTGSALPMSSATLESLQWLQAAASVRACAPPEPPAPLLPALGRGSPSSDTLDGGQAGLATAAREALAQVYAARGAPAGKAARGGAIKWQREGKTRKAGGGGLQLCKVCETHKLPQHFYNRHKTCKDCQCQINRIARSQHCTRDEAKRQVNAAAYAARHGLAPPDAAAAATVTPQNPLLAEAFGVGCVATSGTPPEPSAPRDASRSPDQLRLLTEGGEAEVGARASRTGLSFGACGIDRLADVACAILEGGYDPTDVQPSAKHARIMCASLCLALCRKQRVWLGSFADFLLHTGEVGSQQQQHSRIARVPSPLAAQRQQQQQRRQQQQHCVLLRGA